MRLCLLSSFLILAIVFLNCSALPWTQGYLKYGKDTYLSPSKFWNNGLNREPNCNELRAMWRFSMIKSRKTEMTNEIPTYRDPFAYNVWEPHARSNHLQNSPFGIIRNSENHVYGKVVHSPPADKNSEQMKLNGRSFIDVAKFLATEKPITPRRKNAEAYRLPNGAVSFHETPALLDSFRKLKAIVKAQRAKEMQDQHLAQQTTTPGTVKDTGNGHHKSPSFEVLYNGNASLSGKRNLASKTHYFIANPALFMYPKYYDQFLADQYRSGYGFYYKPHVGPMMRYSLMPAHMVPFHH